MLKTFLQLIAVFIACMLIGFGVVEVTRVFHPEAFATIQYQSWPLWSFMYCFFIGALGFALALTTIFLAEATT